MDTEDPAARIERIACAATVHRTPCGEGDMVWHAWGDGDPLVLLHGGYGSWLHWIRNVEPLASRWRVLAADLPGLGDSADPPRPYTPESIAAIVSAGIDRILGAHRPCRLVGFSFGAHVAGHVAALRGARVPDLVLVGAAAMGLRRAPMPDLVRAQPRSSEEEQRAVHRTNLGALMFADPANIDALAIEIQVRNVRRARTRSRPFAGTTGLRDALERVESRLAGVWGAHDATAAPYVGERERLLRRLRPGCPFTVVPGAGHWVMYEAPDAFHAALEEALAPRHATEATR